MKPLKQARGFCEGKQAFESSGQSDFKQRYTYFIALAKALAERFHPKIALDIGCTGGDLVYTLRELGVVTYGVDINAYALHHSIDAVRGHLLQINVDSDGLPFDDDSFDLVTTLDVIEHLHRPYWMISEMRRVLKNGGVVFMTTICPPFDTRLWSTLGIQRDPIEHPNTHSKSFWVKVFQAQGFRYIGDLSQVVRQRTLLMPPHFWLVQSLMKFGPLGRWGGTKLWNYIIGSFLFRLYK